MRKYTSNTWYKYRFFTKIEQVMYFPKKLEPTLLFNKITKCPNTVPDRSRILKSTIVLMKSKMGQIHLSQAGQAPVSLIGKSSSPPRFIAWGRAQRRFRPPPPADTGAPRWCTTPRRRRRSAARAVVPTYWGRHQVGKSWGKSWGMNSI